MAALRRIVNLFRRNRVNTEIDAELQAHIDLRVDANLAAGMSPAEARRHALVQFGNLSATRERVAGADAALGLAGIWRDIRYAARQLRKSKGFSITVIATLAIGIGANVAIFSSMDAVVLRPLAVPAMDRVVIVGEEQQQRENDTVALANLTDWAQQSRSFEQLSVRASRDLTLTGAGDAAAVRGTSASASFFSVLRTQAFLGRVFDASECQPGRDGVAVLNYGFWQRHFGANAEVLGQKIELDQRVYTIVGVLPKTMQYPAGTDIFVPFAPTPAQLADRNSRAYMVLGRLRDGVTVKQAQSEMRLVAGRLAKNYPATNQGWTVRVEPLLDSINGDLTPLYYKLILGATLFVLLVVCANIANLQLARGVARRPEIAMRTALGASRRRIIRQLLTENILLALLGAAGGVAFAAIYLHAILITMPARVAHLIPGWTNMSINGRALAYSLALAVGAGVAAGLVPSIEALRIKLVEQLRAGSRQSTGGKRAYVRNIFAVAQIALAVALVIGAALMAKGMNAMLHQADVYGPNKILTLGVNLPIKRYTTAEKQSQWYAEALDRLRAIPGVKRAEITAALPYSDNGWTRSVTIENRPVMAGKVQTSLNLAVTPGYFNSFHVAILDGRGLQSGDSIHSTPVAVVSRKFVDRYFPGQNPLGHRIRMGEASENEPWLTIVGVAQDVPYSMWEEDPPPVYVSVTQVPLTGSTLAVFTDGNPLALATSARKALASIDPQLPIDPLQTYAGLIRDDVVGLIYAAVMLGIDALIALLLAAIGIFGVMANLVGERTREIGVRLALGAQRGNVLGLILRRASWLTGTGITIGLVLAFVLAHLVANLLRGVRPDDPIVFAVITVTIAAAALGSSWIPARRAARVDPMQALRAE